ncbi:MAG: nuclear transport factor 2 family protein [Flavobacteriales bacterium]|mgnify:FL=1|nr:nuclear transport factor 2 family protein [Flavobacteriales bacterium]
MPTTNKSIATKWFAAFNAHDLDALLALYKDDAEHYSPKLKVHQPKTNGWVRGKKALRGWWQDAFDRLPELQYEVMGMITDEEQVFMEYIRHVPGEDDLRVGEVLEIRDGMIVGSRVYHG